MLNFCFHEPIDFIEFRRFSAILASLMALVAPSLHIHNSLGKQKVTSEESFFHDERYQYRRRHHNRWCVDSQ